MALHHSRRSLTKYDTAYQWSSSSCFSRRIDRARADRSSNSKTTGQYHSTKGNVVEAIGNLTGAQSWQQSGKEEHAQGEAEYNAAQAKGYAEGTVDRMGGKMDAVVGAVTGDRQQEISGESRGFTTTRSSTGADFTRRQRPPRQGPGSAGVQQELLNDALD